MSVLPAPAASCMRPTHGAILTTMEPTGHNGPMTSLRRRRRLVPSSAKPSRPARAGMCASCSGVTSSEPCPFRWRRVSKPFRWLRTDAADFASSALTRRHRGHAESGSPPWCWEGAGALSPRGRRYQPATIDARWRYGTRTEDPPGRWATQGPPTFGEEDREHFRSTWSISLSRGRDTGTRAPSEHAALHPVPRKPGTQNPTPAGISQKPPTRWRGRDGVVRKPQRPRPIPEAMPQDRP